jgi:hypothetical protein
MYGVPMYGTAVSYPMPPLFYTSQPYDEIAYANGGYGGFNQNGNNRPLRQGRTPGRNLNKNNSKFPKLSGSQDVNEFPPSPIENPPSTIRKSVDQLLSPSNDADDEEKNAPEIILDMPSPPAHLTEQLSPVAQSQATSQSAASEAVSANLPKDEAIEVADPNTTDDRASESADANRRENSRTKNPENSRRRNDKNTNSTGNSAGNNKDRKPRDSNNKDGNTRNNNNNSFSQRNGQRKGKDREETVQKEKPRPNINMEVDFPVFVSDLTFQPI